MASPIFLANWQPRANQDEARTHGPHHILIAYTKMDKEDTDLEHTLWEAKRTIKLTASKAQLWERRANEKIRSDQSSSQARQ